MRRLTVSKAFSRITFVQLKDLAGDVCDCPRGANSGGLEQRHISGTSKQRAASPLASIAKRAKIGTGTSQPSDMVPFQADPYVDTMSTMPFDPLSFSFGGYEQQDNQIVTPNFNQNTWALGLLSEDVFNSGGDFSTVDLPFLQEGNMSQVVEDELLLPDPALTVSKTQAAAHQLVLNSPPVDFLAMQKTQGKPNSLSKESLSLLEARFPIDSCLLTTKNRRRLVHTHQSYHL